jgi:hypothetical protein
MRNEFKPRYVESTRLKEVNLELGRLANQHRTCRLHSGIFSGLGAAMLAVCLLGLIQLLPAGASDWTQNPESPVYAIAAQDQSAFRIKATLLSVGFVIGLALLYTARRQCVRQRSLWHREGNLRKQMRQLRDELYVVNQVRSVRETHPKRQLEQAEPLDPDEARGEYVGVYNPPASHRGPEHA